MHGLSRRFRPSAFGGHAGGPEWDNPEVLGTGLPGARQADEVVDRPGAQLFDGREMFIAKNYLEVEVALFPAKGENLGVIDGHFSLRVNGRKQALSPQAPEFVAASLKYPDTDYGRQAVAALGPVVLGAPRPVERFPGDPNAQTTRLPQDDSSGIDAAAREAGGVGGSGGFARRRAPRAGQRVTIFYLPRQAQPHSLAGIGFASPAGDSTLPPM